MISENSLMMGGVRRRPHHEEDMVPTAMDAATGLSARGNPMNSSSNPIVLRAFGMDQIDEEDFTDYHQQ